MIITANGTPRIDTVKSISIVYVSGTLGGGVAKLGYIASGVFVPFVVDSAELTLTTGEQYELHHGYNMPVFLQLVGSTSPNLEIIVKWVS